MKLNDAYEEINNIAQIEETNSVLKQDVERMKLENANLMEKAEELKDMVNEADKQVELRDTKLNELSENLQRMMEEKMRIEQELDDIQQGRRENNGVELGTRSMGGVTKDTADVIQYSRAVEVTSESPKLERELMQTSSENDVDVSKQSYDQGFLEQKENEMKILKEQLQEVEESKAMVEQQLEKNKKISGKLKNMVKNSRMNAETLRNNLESAKEENLEKEQTMQGLRGEMADLVEEKEKLIESLMSRLKSLDLGKDESIKNLRFEFNEILKKKETNAEKISRDLNSSISRGDELKSQLDMWRNSYNDVTEKMNEMDNELTDVQGSLDISFAEHSRTKETSTEQLNQAGETIEKLTERLQNITGDFESSEKSRSDLETNLDLLRTEKDSIVSQKGNIIEHLQTELENTKENLHGVTVELQEKSKNCEDLLQEKEKVEERFQKIQEELNGNLDQKDDIIRRLEEDLENANESIHNISLKFKEKSREYKVASTEKDLLQKHLNDSHKEAQNSSMLQEEVMADTSRNLDAANSKVEELSEKLTETSFVLGGERKRKEELDEISASLRKDLELRTEQKRELQDVVMNLNMDLEKTMRDREELRQALRLKQTVTQGCDNARFDEEILQQKESEKSALEAALKKKEREVVEVDKQLNEALVLNQDLKNESKISEERFQETITNYENEKRQLEEMTTKLEHDLQQSIFTKEEAVNVLRMKLEAAVEEKGDLTSSLKNEYNKMLSEKDERIARIQEDVERVNEEFTNLGYRFELTLQDGVNKGNKIVQLQNELKEKVRILEENGRLQQHLDSMVQRTQELEEELDYLKDNTNKSDSEKLYDELQNTKAMVKTLENQLGLERKERETSKSKEKKEFKRLAEAFQFDLENSRKQNLEKEKSLQNLRVELEEIMKQKEALFQKLRTPSKGRTTERLQKSGDVTPVENVVEKLREEKTELLRDLDRTRQQKDEIFAKFHNIGDGLRRDLEEAINIRDEKVEEALEVKVMLDKIERENSELQNEVQEKNNVIEKLSANLEKKNEWSDSIIGQLRAENEKIKATSAQELMNSQQKILRSRNTNEELQQSLTKAEFDRENLRNYTAAKEVQSEELKRQLVSEIAERKRLSEELRIAAGRGGAIKKVEETILESSVENYESFNQTRNELDEVSKNKTI